MTKKSIRNHAIEPLIRLFNLIALVGLIGIVTISAYQLHNAKKEAEILLINFASRVSASADIEGRLYALQKELDNLSDALEISGAAHSKMEIEINGRIIASSGSKNQISFPIRVERRINLNSGNKMIITAFLDFFSLIQKTFLSEISALILFLLLIRLVESRVKRSLEDIALPLEKLTRELELVDVDANTSTIPMDDDSGLTEIEHLRRSIRLFVDRIQTDQREILKLKSNEIFGSIARQVAHDIRSPLSALEMFSSNLQELPEEKRTILRNSMNRIRDIANSLISKKSEHFAVSTEGSIDQSEKRRVELLLPIVDSLVTEKRLQYRDRIHIHIELNQTSESYGLFSNIEVTEFKRVLSNIINNSIESLTTNTGKVLIQLSSTNSFNIVSIEDTGKGIPSDIITNLGNLGATYNKVAGTGLGLYHAKKTLGAWGGRFEIISQPGKGTNVTILLPREKEPEWFVPLINVNRNLKIVILDDDQTIHEIWKRRFGSFLNYGIELIHLSTPTEMRKYYRENFCDLENALFLVDQELLGHTDTGLDLVIELAIQGQSYLVTSHFDEVEVRIRCTEFGIKLIPKSMAPFIPLLSS